MLEKSTNDKVCRHMQGVYNRHFAYPFKRPSLTARRDDPAYGPNGRYAFPKLPGVTHDNRMTLDMGFSRFPTSPEFDAIEWKEGRYRLTGMGGSPDHGDQPMLVAEFDIDNDGVLDTVVKDRFMRSYLPGTGGGAPGGEDTLFIFQKGAIDYTRPVVSDMFYTVQEGKKGPVLISGLSNSSRLIRPFRFEGINYLSSYQPQWENRYSVSKERIEIARYRSGGEKLGPPKAGPESWSPLRLDQVCEFRMRVVRPR